MGVSIVAYRGEEWLGEMTVNQLNNIEDLRTIVDSLTKRGPRLKK